ncbi:hypothetical protein PAERUG_E10_London_26_VIM_2_06_13_02264 [Pseudomonas aeruginosa]|nr:hypothetical protein PAERUG_E10_London_26_VIM_2_06_13_02264 [Pseudomonas aeruginosa]CRP43108.1 hypothetical protein PAERUG_P2_London_28_IMP_1_06_05_02771 [Pseudomonas aeruginosa]
MRLRFDAARAWPAVPERHQQQAGEQRGGGEHEEHREGVEVARQQAAEDRPDRAAAVDEAGGGTGCFAGTEVDGGGAADHRVRPVEGDAHHEQQADHQVQAAALHRRDEQRQAHGQRRQAEHAGRHAAGAEQLVRGLADEDRPGQPGDLEGRRHDGRGDFADLRHAFVDDHRAPEQDRVARRLEQEVGEAEDQHVGIPERLQQGAGMARPGRVGGGRGLGLHGRQADVLRTVALEEEEQHGHRQHHSRRGQEGHAPVMRQPVGAPAGERRRHQPAEGVAGTPQAEHAASLVGGEEGADVLAQPRPAGGLRQALDHHAGGEDRQGGEGTHHQRRQRRGEQTAEHHHAGAEAVGEHPPHELAHGVGGQVEGIEIGHGALVELEGGVFGDAELGHREGLAGEVEGGVGQPGDDEDLDAPALERLPATVQGTVVVVHVGPYGSRQCGEVVLVVLLQSCPDAWSRPDAFPMTFFVRKVGCRRAPARSCRG